MSLSARSRRRGAPSGNDTQRTDAEGNQLIAIAAQLLAAPVVRRRLLKFLRGNLRRGRGAVVYSETLEPGQQLVITHLTETRGDEKRQARADKKTAKAEKKAAKRAERAARRAEKAAGSGAEP